MKGRHNIQTREKPVRPTVVSIPEMVDWLNALILAELK